MSFIKPHINAWLSLTAFVAASLMTYCLFALSPSSGSGPWYDLYLFWASFILVIMGIICGFKSDAQGESKWIGKTLILIGILSSFLFLYYLGFGSPNNVSGIAIIVLLVATVMLIVSWVGRRGPKGR